MHIISWSHESAFEKSCSFISRMALTNIYEPSARFSHVLLQLEESVTSEVAMFRTSLRVEEGS